jgi:small GTP-binding protein
VSFPFHTHETQLPMSSSIAVVCLLAIGGSGTGKSSCVLRYTQPLEFSDQYMPTMGLDLRLRLIATHVPSPTYGRPDTSPSTYHQHDIKVQIWDFAGQERFASPSADKCKHYANAGGIAVFYSIADTESFFTARKYLDEIKLKALSHAAVILVGNKCDLVNDRQISTDDGNLLAKEYGVSFLEASAKTNVNIEDLFNLIARQAYQVQRSAPDPKLTVVIRDKADDTIKIRAW